MLCSNVIHVASPDWLNAPCACLSWSWRKHFEQRQLCCKQLRNHWGTSLLRVVILSGVVLWPGCLWLLRLKDLPPLEQTEGNLQAFTHIHCAASLSFGLAAKLERYSHAESWPICCYWKRVSLFVMRSGVWTRSTFPNYTTFAFWCLKPKFLLAGNSQSRWCSTFSKEDLDRPLLRIPLRPDSEISFRCSCCSLRFTWKATSESQVPICRNRCSDVYGINQATTTGTSRETKK